MKTSLGISAGGRERLLEAIAKQVQLEFQQELATTTEHSARLSLEKKIADEVKQRMKDVASPQSLWGAA